MAEQSHPLLGQVAVVTGASRGIGRAIAVDFARAGADIVVTARTSASAPSKLPGTSEEQVREMARRTLQEFGRCDILVNNAGISSPAPFHETPLKRWDLVMNVNLRGPVMCMQAFLPSMIERRSGRVINISSFLAEVMLPGMISYSVSKIALEKLTKYTGQELRQFNIPVNALRIELNIATEGWMFRSPNMDFSDWEKPEAASETTLWLATQPTSYTGNVVTIAEVREAMAKA